MPTADVVVVGGGIIGTAIAWRSAQHGLDVVLVDPSPGTGAWTAAAGMLAPVPESAPQDPADPLLRLGLDSAARYPALLAELGADVGYSTEGSLEVALDGPGEADLARLHRLRERLGLASERVAAEDLRRREPALAPSVLAGLLCLGDASLDPRRLVAALRAAAAAEGVRTCPRRVDALERRRGRVVGVRLADDTVLPAGTVVLAAGAASGRLLPALAVRPVKGQVVRLRAPGFLHHTVSATAAGMPVYLVPRPDGELVVGATSEESADTAIRAGAVHALLAAAIALAPGIGGLEVTGTSAGLRPAGPDGVPLIGAWEDGLVVATGHHRNGVLLAPVTADAVAGLLATGRTDPGTGAFAPRRIDAPVS